MKKERIPFHPLNEERTYAVLVPVLTGEKGEVLLFTKRSAALKNQPGDLCFPGGCLLPGETPEAGAIRETKEELLLSNSQIEKLFPLPAQLAPDGCALYPFYAKIKGYRGSYNAAEVSNVLFIPKADLLRTPPERHGAVLEAKPDEDFPYELVEGKENRLFAKKRITWLFYRHTQGTIWGVTANVLWDYLEEKG